MAHPSSSVAFFVQIAKLQSRLSFRFDRSLGGISFTELLVLLALEQAPQRSLSRIELAQDIGLTASGITRVLLPMAKVHLVKDGPTTDDARVRTVTATGAGRQKLADELHRLQYITDDLLPKHRQHDVTATLALLHDIGQRLTKL